MNHDNRNGRLSEANKRDFSSIQTFELLWG